MSEPTPLDRLRAQVEYAPSWRPEPGDTIVGTAIAWSTYEKQDPASGEKKQCPILAVRDQAGAEHAIWCWHAVLRHELVDKVEPGDLVAISYVGKRPRQSGDGSYHCYRVAVAQARGETPEHADHDDGQRNGR
jgi:hypothetical protein